jgi:hypothetical protein
MEVGVADMIANGQPWSLFGDQLYLDLGLSSENLPVGSTIGGGLRQMTHREDERTERSGDGIGTWHVPVWVGRARKIGLVSSPGNFALYQSRQ